MTMLPTIRNFDSFLQNVICPQWAYPVLIQADNKNKEGYGCLIKSAPLDSAYEIPIDGLFTSPNHPQKGILYPYKPKTLQWHNIELNGSNGNSILKSVSGEVRTGELTAIMGPSGAGKTTLLNVLSGYKRQKVSGKILLNNKKREMRSFRKIACYITQDDHLLPYLTARETVYLATLLKIPTSIQKKDKEKVVDDCLQSLGLTECQHTRAYQLSGGQRKRLCIAQELVSNPLILFLDEPTSGLDSSSCLQCIKLLKSLAEEGRTVVCTIHQPSARIFELFDKLYLLASGHCIYRGPTYEFITFLTNQGLKCPSYHSITDFAIEVAIGDHGNWIEKLKNAIELKDDLLDYSNMIEETGFNGWLNNKNIKNDQKTSNLCLIEDKTKKSLFYSSGLEPEENTKGYATSYWNQFKVLSYRSLICDLREPMVTLVRFLSHVLVGVLIGLLYFGIGNDASKAYNNVGLIFFSLLFLSFTATMPVAVTFHTELKIFARDHLNNWYDIKMYYLAKTLTEMPFQICLPAIFANIVYWMTAQPTDMFRFLTFLLSAVSLSFVAQSFALISCTASSNALVSVFLCPVLSIPFVLFSGFFIHLDAIPSYLNWFSYLSYYRYSFHSTLQQLYSFNRTNLYCEKAFCLFQNPQTFLEELDMADGNIFVDYAALLALFIAFRLLAYFALWFRVVYNR